MTSPGPPPSTSARSALEALAPPPLDPIRRLRILAESLPHVALAERVYDVSFERLWGFVGDLERSAPVIELGIARAAILEREGDRLVVETRNALGLPLRFDVELRPGWCLMQHRLGDVGMAAAPEGDGTRFAHFEGARPLGRLGRPVFARKIAGDLERIAAALEHE